MTANPTWTTTPKPAGNVAPATAPLAASAAIPTGPANALDLPTVPSMAKISPRSKMMNKVNSLYQDERNAKFLALVKKFRADGYTREEAEEMAEEDLQQEDRDNSQFGVGA